MICIELLPGRALEARGGGAFCSILSELAWNREFRAKLVWAVVGLCWLFFAVVLPECFLSEAHGGVGTRGFPGCGIDELSSDPCDLEELGLAGAEERSGSCLFDAETREKFFVTGSAMDTDFPDDGRASRERIEELGCRVDLPWGPTMDSTMAWLLFATCRLPAAVLLLSKLDKSERVRHPNHTQVIQSIN